MKKEKTKESIKAPVKTDTKIVKKTEGKKRKKLLKTPSHIIRLCMVWLYVLAVFFLVFPFVTTSLYLKDDLTVGTDLSSAKLIYASQEEIDEAADELEAAINALEPSGEKSLEEASYAVSPATFDWKYHILDGIKTTRIESLIAQSKELDRVAYTDKTIKAVNTATLKAQQKLCATVTVSQSAFQIVLGGSLNNLPEGDLTGLLLSGAVMYALVLMPVIGFFIAAFDKTRHIKNVYTIICTLFCIVSIFIVIYPHIGLGAVLSIFDYILLFILSAAGIYAKQQEDYIKAHPELEPEFSEKHPHFVKALINLKAVTLAESIEKEEKEKLFKEKTEQNKKSKKKS